MNAMSKVGNASNFGRRLKDQHFSSKIQNIKQLASLGFDDEAFKELAQIQRMKNLTVMQSVQIADCLYKLGKFEECLKALRPLEDQIDTTSSKMVNDKLVLFNMLGIVYRALGKEELAVMNWKECLVINSRYTIALNNLGNHFMHAHEYLNAAKCYWRSKKCTLCFTRLRQT